MYGSVVRTDEYKRRLCDFIRHEYAITAAALTPAKRGYYGETWRLDASGQSYFLKLDYSAAHKAVYERSFAVVEHLRGHGVGCISRIVKTADGRLYSRFDGAVLGIFDWVDGENVQNERTKIAEYGILGQVYAVEAGGLSIARDSFSTQSADLFFWQWKKIKESADRAGGRIVSVIDQHRERLFQRAQRLALFAKRCSADTSHFYITHGDAGGNVIVNGDDFYIVDWDDPRLAPPERDAWFCLYWDWAAAAFHDALDKNGIDYTLRCERLAYYCYHSFFHYLNEYMETYFDRGDPQEALSDSLSQFFNGWIEEEIRYADMMF